MSSTNKTPNYELSQYVGTDKPTYLGDYNGDMLRIDTQMKANNDMATNAVSSAGEAVAKAEQAQNNVDALKTRMSNVEQDITQAESNITQLQTTVTAQGQTLTSTTNTANSAKANADLAKGAVDSNVWTPVTKANSAGVIRGDLSCSFNPFLNIINFRGELTTTSPVNANTLLFTLPTNIPRPTNERTITAFAYLRDQSQLFGGGITVRIDTAGRIYNVDTIAGNAYLYVQQMLNTTGWFD